MRRRRRSGITPDDGWTSNVSSGLALAGFLAFVLAGFTWLAMGPLESLDAYFNLQPAPPGWVPFLHVLDRIGQRAVCLPVLAVVTLYCCRRQESWRPAWVVAISVFSLNLFVLILKVSLGRAEPVSANPSFFAGGMAYPSGHTSNIVLVYGLCVFLLSRYGRVRRSAVLVMWAAVVVLSLVMVTTSLTLRWHWFADLIAGLISGGIVLTLTEAVDAALPEEAVEARLRPVRQWWRARTARSEPARPSAAAEAVDVTPLRPVPGPPGEPELPPALGRPNST